MRLRDFSRRWAFWLETEAGSSLKLAVNVRLDLRIPFRAGRPTRVMAHSSTHEAPLPRARRRRWRGSAEAGLATAGGLGRRQRLCRFLDDRSVRPQADG